MNNMKTLEERVEAGLLKKYIVDTTASWTFYMPLMAMTEFASGMTPKQVAVSRACAAAIHLFTARPQGALRHYTAEKLGVTPESSNLKKNAFDTVFGVAYQLPVYSTILALSGTSFDKAKIALPCGLLIGATMSRAYSYFLDKWRNYWGTKPTLEEQKTI